MDSYGGYNENNVNMQGGDEEDDVSNSFSHVSNETSGLSVRDMIKRYDTAIKKVSESRDGSQTGSHLSLSAALKAANSKSMTRSGVRQFVAKVNESEQLDKLKQEMNANLSRRLSQAVSENSSFSQPNNSFNTYQNRTMNSSVRSGSRSCISEDVSNNTQFENIDLGRNRNIFTEAQVNDINMDSPDFVDDLVSVQTSYQSRTTISRSDAGVRIIIDIFFDQDGQPTAYPPERIGSRIETDIPGSNILNDFQDQTLSARDSR